MNRDLKVSLIVTTYNNPAVLALSLKSIARQKELPDEVIVGDDGSTDDTRQLIDKIRETFPVPLIHVWQEDEGFQLARIRNKCLAKAKYEYIIQIDGDIVANPNFVADHKRFARKDYYLKGTRLCYLQDVTAKMKEKGEYFIPNMFSGGIKRRFNALRMLPVARYFAPRYKKNVVGANMSYWRDDAIAVNGYDEGFVGWGGEDFDFACRLTNAGKKSLALKFAALVYHLWHNENSKSNVEKNKQRYLAQSDASVIRCGKGIDQYL